MDTVTAPSLFVQFREDMARFAEYPFVGFSSILIERSSPTSKHILLKAGPVLNPTTFISINSSDSNQRLHLSLRHRYDDHDYSVRYAMHDSNAIVYIKGLGTYDETGEHVMWTPDVEGAKCPTLAERLSIRSMFRDVAQRLYNRISRVDCM